MKRYFSLLARPFLCLIAILLVTTSMIVAAQGKCIDLKLNEKPACMSTYEWCKKMAEGSIDVKVAALLVFLKVKTKKDWENCRSNVCRSCECCSCKIVAMPENIQDCVYSVFNNCAVVDAVRPVAMYEESGDDGAQRIVIETENFGIIKVIAVSGDLVGWTTFVQGGHIIGLSPSEIKELKLSNDSIEGTIGHELAHILYDHAFDGYVIENVHNENCCEVGCCECKKYNSYFYAFLRAREIEADIVGTFGNPRWVKGLIERHKKLEARYIYEDDFGNYECPTNKQRTAYLQEIYRSLKKG